MIDLEKETIAKIPMRGQGVTYLAAAQRKEVCTYYITLLVLQRFVCIVRGREGALWVSYINSRLDRMREGQAAIMKVDSSGVAMQGSACGFICTKSIHQCTP